MKQKHLLNDTYETGTKQVQELLFGQYKLYVEMADKISHRRTRINLFYVGINTVLISLVSLAAQLHSHIYFLNTAGLALCILWFFIIKSYKNVSSAKYFIINEIEENLPLKPYVAELDILKRGSNKKYWAISGIERWIPAIFSVIYIWSLIIMV